MDKSKKVRTRFAPSPTGELHIGGLWMALFQWLHAKHHGGSFILRIEDTDQKRTVDGSEERIIELLKWYGVDFDEGPGREGDYGPYRQSERLAIYKKYSEELLSKNFAYHCFCTSERLKALREKQQLNKQPTGYDGACRDLSKDEVTARVKSEETHVLRMRVPQEGSTSWHDIIRGEVSFENALIDDQVIVKSDGWPTYHLANVIDDHLMEINPVIRGEEWLSSTPKHLLLYEAFGWPPPVFAHLPLILGKDRAKLSKRDGSVSAASYRHEGYLVDAVINFLALLGWNPKNSQEIFSREELIAAFRLEHVSKAGAFFDVKKLDWYNNHYLRKLTTTELFAALTPYLEEANLLKVNGNAYVSASGITFKYAALVNAVASIQDRLKTLKSAVEEMESFLNPPNYKATLLPWKKITPEETKESLLWVQKLLVNTAEEVYESSSDLEALVIKEIKSVGRNNGDTLWPLRVALSGREQSPPPFVLMSVFGKTEVLKRIKVAIALLTV